MVGFRFGYGKALMTSTQNVRDDPARNAVRFVQLTLASSSVVEKSIDLLRKSLLDADMKAKIITLSLGFLFAAGTVFAGLAGGPLMGVWKLNEAGSKLAPGTGKHIKVIYDDLLFDRFKVETWGLDAAGNKIHTEWKGKFDGQDYEVKGDATTDTRAYTKIDDHTLTMINKKAGKVVSTGRVEVSPDSKSRKVTLTGRTPTGRKFNTVAVYQKTLL
jgi:hypothetical protein